MMLWTSWEMEGSFIFSQRWELVVLQSILSCVALDCAGMACATYLTVAASCSSWRRLNRVSVSVRVWERSECWWNIQWEIWIARLFKYDAWLSLLTPALGRWRRSNLFAVWIHCYVHWHCQSLVERQCSCLLLLLSIEEIISLLCSLISLGHK